MLCDEICEYSVSQDLTGENGMQCGATPVVVCKSCGPLCSTHKNHPCFELEHEFVEEDDELELARTA